MLRGAALARDDLEGSERATGVSSDSRLAVPNPYFAASILAITSAFDPPRS